MAAAPSKGKTAKRKRSEPSGANSENSTAATPAPTTVQKSLQCVLYILGGYTLAPSPLPPSLVKSWSTPLDSKSSTCQYCGGEGAILKFPQVNISLEKQTITFVDDENVCKFCHDVLDLCNVVKVIDRAFTGSREEFDNLYDHFLKVNNLQNKEDVLFQDLVSMAFSLKYILEDIPFKLIK